MVKIMEVLLEHMAPSNTPGGNDEMTMLLLIIPQVRPNVGPVLEAGDVVMFHCQKNTKDGYKPKKRWVCPKLGYS